MQGVLVDGDHLQLLVGKVEDGAAGSLVNAPVLHADQPVLHDVQDADAVLAAQLVQTLDDLGDLHLLAVQGHGGALFKLQGEVGGFVGAWVGETPISRKPGLSY